MFTPDVRHSTRKFHDSCWASAGMSELVAFSTFWLGSEGRGGSWAMWAHWAMWGSWSCQWACIDRLRMLRVGLKVGRPDSRSFCICCAAIEFDCASRDLEPRAEESRALDSSSRSWQSGCGYTKTIVFRCILPVMRPIS